MNIAKQTIWTLLVLVTLLFTACQEEEVVKMPDINQKGLCISLSLGGEKPVYLSRNEKQTRITTIEGENSLNENTIREVCFYLVNPSSISGSDTTWTLKQSWIFNVPTEDDLQQDMTNDPDNNLSTEEKPQTPDYYPVETFKLASGNNWATTLGLTHGSRLYAIANVKDWSRATVNDQNGNAIAIDSYDDVDTWEKLKSLAITDATIYKTYSATTPTADQVQSEKDKHFLMDGFVHFTSTEVAIYQTLTGLEHEKTINLKRAAAKVRVNIYKDNEWKDNNKQLVSIDTAKIESMVMNHAIGSKVVTPEAGESWGNTQPKEEYDTLKSYSRTDASTLSGKTYLRSVLFYTFAHDWSNDLGHETTFIMNLPYSIPKGSNESPRPQNWYKIVFVPDGGQYYHRNTFYEVNVTVAYDGSDDSYVPAEVENPEYTVSEWYPEDMDVENTTPVDYLILDKYYLDLRNEADASITFYSSNKVVVEVVHDVMAEKSDMQRIYPWSEEFADFNQYIGEAVDASLLTPTTTVAEIPGIYYPDKENRRIPIYHENGKSNNTNHSTADSYYGPYQQNNTEDYLYDNTVSDGTKVFTDLNRAKYLPITVKPDGAYEAEKKNSEVYITWPGNRHSQQGESIQLYSAIPRNATLRFITLKVTMDKLYGEGTITRYVVIKQYPLEYIVNQFGYYSFFDADILKKDNVATYVEHRGTLDKNKKANNGLYSVYCSDYEAGKDRWVLIPDSIVYGLGKARTTTDLKFYGETTINYALNGHFSRYPNMKCKFYLDGTSNTYSSGKEQHTWYDSEGKHVGIIYQIDAGYLEDEKGTNTADIQGLYTNTPSNNNRMYEVKITATSSKYRIGYPETKEYTDENGNVQIYADESYENNLLVSPHFVIASQLGNSSATPFWEVAQDQCLHYVEVDNKGNVFKDWRLPTIAELSIIKQFQLDDDVFNVTMNRILNSDGETNPRYWTAGKDPTGTYGMYVNTTGEGTQATIAHTGDAQTIVKGIHSGKSAYKGDKEVRIRCVRDIKQ